VVWHARPGEEVHEGQPLLTLLTDQTDRFDRALEALDGGYDIGDRASYTPQDLVIDRIG
jgi:thymidine phosphorylase